MTVRPTSVDAADEGSTTTEVVLLTPAVLLMVMLIVQFGLLVHARQVATAAAQEGLAAAQTVAGSGEDGRDEALTFLDEAGGVHEAAVAATRTASRAAVEVRGTALSVLPGWRPAVTGIAEGPVERFIPEPDR